MKKGLFIPLLALAAASLACSVTIDLPVDKVEEADTQTFTFSQPPLPGQEEVEISIVMGAGELNIRPGSDQWAEGEIEYNIANLEPRFTASGNVLEISQNIESLRALPVGKTINQWDIALGNQTPMQLSVSAGAYDGDLDLSGLPISRLEISDGASNATVRFEEPNPIEMERFIYRTGASAVRLEELANANFAELEFSGGAGSYELDFEGDLRRDAHVRIESGVSSLVIRIPEGARARIQINGDLLEVNTRGQWSVEDNVYSTSLEDADSPGGPLLDIEIGTGLGSLELIHQ
ncbi:MAG: hypothetical protein GYA48_01600 [Chloroflexi bacterium]|nr:hypothetical protein [Chloroflexota bacterium]